MEDGTRKRRQALKRGRISEYVAAAFLILRGYQIVTMHFRVGAGEIDIIARKRDLICFVEVKARATTDGAITAVTGESQRRIHNASLAWLSRQPDGSSLSLRYDIIAISPFRLPKHFLDAF
ncbi:YraN family protein [Rhizobium alvei]|uniref:UPF0102 protein Q4481_16710 n=1 Tax=Rhizobium alvei TaxID=1132659 RepID=A0ABT8YPF2_9HYPH|nr:YraN family protein [Rhizobium alvei]MDO6965608.1 YraN family protein [Rhizobium alvei]